MKKRLLSILLALCMVLSLLPGTALAADTDFDIFDGYLINYTGPGGDVVIPDGVKYISDLTFYRCNNLTSVTIPESVTAISEDVFAGCSGLTSAGPAGGGDTALNLAGQKRYQTMHFMVAAA